MKNQKQPFRSVEKIAANFFSKFTGKHQSRKHISQAFNSIKKETPTEMLCNAIFEMFQGTYFLIKSQGDHFWLPIGTNKHVATNKDS